MKKIFCEYSTYANIQIIISSKPLVVQKMQEVDFIDLKLF